MACVWSVLANLCFLQVKNCWLLRKMNARWGRELAYYSFLFFDHLLATEKKKLIEGRDFFFIQKSRCLACSWWINSKTKWNDFATSCFIFTISFCFLGLTGSVKYIIFQKYDILSTCIPVYDCVLFCFFFLSLALKLPYFIVHPKG